MASLNKKRVFKLLDVLDRLIKPTNKPTASTTTTTTAATAASGYMRISGGGGSSLQLMRKGPLQQTLPALTAVSNRFMCHLQTPLLSKNSKK